MNPVRICVPVCATLARDLSAEVAQASTVADIIELRLDYLPQSELRSAARELRDILAHRQRQIILTFRPAEYGGARAISLTDRLSLRTTESWASPTVENGVDFWDLEVDLATLLAQRELEGNDLPELGLCNWDKTICSYHDFVGLPPNLQQLYQQMSATPARILKIAVQLDDAIDCIPIFRLLDRARAERRELIAIGMGTAGIMTRILGPSRGSFLTYGSMNDDSATAPGQIRAEDMRQTYRIEEIDEHTQIFGIIGRPVSHSISPEIHNAWFRASNLNAVYLPMEVHDTHAFLHRMVRPQSREIDWDLGGLSVTAPHKIAVMNSLDYISEEAKAIGAVNTIIVENGELRGYNTDAHGFIEPLRRMLGQLTGARCAIVGAGGAARAALWALAQAGARAELFVRDPGRARKVTTDFSVDCRSLSETDFRGFDVLVNATPLGTRGSLENETAVTAAQLRNVRLVYDLVYNPPETLLLRTARSAGCETLGGIEMLVAQAALQAKLWTSATPDVEIMKDAALRALRRQAEHQSSEG